MHQISLPLCACLYGIFIVDRKADAEKGTTMTTFRTLDELKADEDAGKAFDHWAQPWKDYVTEAFAHGCFFEYERYRFENICSAIDSNGEHVVFKQGVYGNSWDMPYENTFVDASHGDTALREINRCDQCDGIPIWDTEALLKASRVCGACGKQVERFADLHPYLYAGAACDDCIDAIRKEQDSKPMGYWTD